MHQLRRYRPIGASARSGFDDTRRPVLTDNLCTAAWAVDLTGHAHHRTGSRTLDPTVGALEVHARIVPCADREATARGGAGSDSTTLLHRALRPGRRTARIHDTGAPYAHRVEELDVKRSWLVVVICLWSARIALAQDIERVEVRGNHHVDVETIRAAVATKAGQTLDPGRLRSDLRAIWRLGMFSDVRAATEGDVVTFEVVERPTIRKILVAGNHELALDKIDEVIELTRGAVVDEAAIRRSRDRIADLYLAQGFLFATVDIAQLPADSGEVDVQFTVDEHAKVTVSDIAFTGNRAIASDELRRHMSTSPPGALSFVTSSGVFRFAAVKIAPPALQLSHDRKRMMVRIAIEEGPRFDYGAIDVKGDLLGTRAQHLALIRSRPGARFVRSMVEADRRALEVHYQDLGFANASAAPRPRVDDTHHRIAIDFEIVRGQRVSVERVSIRGNSKTDDKVIRRELRIAEGELFSATKLAQSRQRVMALGYFDGVAIATRRGSSDDTIGVEVEVRERSTSTFQAGVGFSSTESFLVQGQVAMENLLGRGQSLSGQVQLSSVRRLFALHFVDPYFLDSRWTFGAELYNQTRSLGAYARTSTGGSLMLGYPLADRLHGFLTYRLEDVGITSGFDGFAGLAATASPLPALDTADLFRGGWTSSIRGSLAYDTRDNRLLPTSGEYATAYAEYAGRLTGSGNELVRYGGFARHYQHLGPFVLRLNAELGVTQSLGGRGVPLTERYLLGGISDIRGYEPRSLGPHLWSQHAGDVGQPLDPLAIGGNLEVIGNAELEFPLVKSIGVSGVVFFDVGNAYNLESRFCSRPGSDACTGGLDAVGSLRRSVGVGVRWQSPIGPLRFEWGVPLDLKPGEKPDGLEFSIGGSF
ncbi:MAG: outer membrane protein assembly factor BamA [Deltaproteobacteria bacterium]|nr:MAG: outer membrane protein assembly factor BamA [Deltaproteobacteria bacterium]